MLNTLISLHRRHQNWASATYASSLPIPARTFSSTFHNDRLLICSTDTFIQNLIMYPASMGALTPLWGGTSPEGADLNGKVCGCPSHDCFQFLIYMYFALVVVSSWFLGAEWALCTLQRRILSWVESYGRI